MRFPDVSMKPFFVALRALLEIAVFLRESVGKYRWAIKYEIRIAVHVDHDGRVGDAQIFNRFPAAVDQSVPRVKRRSENTPLIPLERLLFSAILPYLGGSVAREDRNDFFIHVLFGFEHAARRNFTDI